MARAKKVKLLDKILAELNGRELISLAMFYGRHDDSSPYFKHTTYIRQVETGIGTFTEATCKDCRATEDITDYDCW